MERLLGLAVALLLLSACKRGAPAGGGSGEERAGSGGRANASAIPDGADAASIHALDPSGAIFSLPIAGAHVPPGPSVAPGAVFGAGLVVSARAIVATRLDPGGKSIWTRVLVPDVSWSADAELHAWPIAAGAAFVWRGPTGKKNGHVAVVVAPDGRILDGPFDVGSFVCATDDGLAWSEGTASQMTRVRLRTYADGAAPRDETSVPTVSDFSLACGAHRAFAVAEGDESAPTKVFAVGGHEGTPPEEPFSIAPMALGRDEERDLFPWVDGDEFGLVRVSNGGEVQAAVIHERTLDVLRSEKARVVPEDDVVGVDVDPRQVVVVTTHDESDACPNGRGGSSVHVLRIPRQSAGATSLRVAPSACAKDVGPFWTNTLARSLVVSWAERASRPAKTSSPITGLAYRVLDEGTATARVAQAADGLADAGCDENRCYAIALARETGTDGMKPESLSVLSYP